MRKTKVVTVDPAFPKPDIIREAVTVLQKGGLVAFPTETVYGLGVNSQNKKALEALYRVKGRANDKPSALLIESIEAVFTHCADITPAAYRLMEEVWPGPLTVIVVSRKNASVGLRIPRNAVALALVRQSSFPIACPSANVSGSEEPKTAQAVLDAFDGKIDMVLDGGAAALGTASTVVDIRESPFRILRAGSIAEQNIRDIEQRKRVLFVCTGNSCRSVMAEALLRKELTKRKRTDIEVLSAGVFAPMEMSASRETQELLKREGIDVSGHHSQRTTEPLLRGSDLILVMERSHERSILQIDPLLRKRLYLLKEFSQFTKGGIEISDPMGRGMDVYRKCIAEIKEATRRVAELI